MIAWLRRVLSGAAFERELREVQEEIARLEDVHASVYARLQYLRERERRLNSKLLLGMDPDEIVRRSGAGA